MMEVDAAMTNRKDENKGIGDSEKEVEKKSRLTTVGTKGMRSLVAMKRRKDSSRKVKSIWTRRWLIKV